MRWKASVSVVPVVLVLVTAVPAQAQSLFSTRGLGVPLLPLDARARALGGIGVGLLGLNTSLVNPADVAGLSWRGVAAVVQPWSGSAELGDESGDIDGTRFPLIRLLLPVSSRTVLSLGFGSTLEQSWAVEIDGFQQLGPDSVPTQDLIESSGGISQISLGISYALSSAFAVGVSGGIYTGNLERTITRTFADSTITADPFFERLRWDYSGPQASVGVRIDPAPFLRLGTSLSVSPDLDVDATEGDAEDGEAKLPLKLTTGASGYLSPELLLAIGAEYASLDDGAVFEFADSVAQQRSTWRFGGGLEWEGARSGDRVFPIRLGASWAQLPYFDLGEEPATEWSGSLGVGFRLASDQTGPRAVADATFERGRRAGLESELNPGGLSESFWRFTFSLALFGN